MMQAILHTDGGSRGNPGQSGFAFSLVAADGTELAAGGWFLKLATNNVAEYSALVWGLQNALEAGVTQLSIRADSELMVKQMNGEYQVRSEDLKPLFKQAKTLAARFAALDIAHVYRSSNERADALANAAMDAQGPVGSFLVPWEEGSSGEELLREEPSRKEGVVFTEKPSSKEEVLPATPKEAFLPEQQDASLFDRCAAEALSECGVELNPRYEGRLALSGEAYELAGGTYELRVKDHFDAAHALIGYDGPCRYLHGHTWEVEATVVGTRLDEVGMLYDFKAIKTDLHALLDNFDHKMINGIPPFDKVNPTAEHMARILYWELAKTLPEGIELCEIAVWESPAARVSYRP